MNSLESLEREKLKMCRSKRIVHCDYKILSTAINGRLFLLRSIESSKSFIRMCYMPLSNNIQFAFGRDCGQWNNCSAVHAPGKTDTVIVKSHSPFQKFNTKEDFVLQCQNDRKRCDLTELPILNGVEFKQNEGAIDMVCCLYK